MKSTKVKRSKGEQILFNIVFVFLCVYAATLVFSFIFILLNTFKGSYEYITTSKFALPKKWVWNYGKVFTTFNVNGNGYFQMVFHSIWFSVTGSIPALLSASMASYAFSRYKFPGRKLIYIINLLMLTLSLPGSQVAFYKLFCELGMKNSWKYIFGCWDGFGSRFLILAGFWRSIDWAYAEAVYIDGGNENTVFWKVMLPQAMPMLGVFFLLSFINSWSNHEFTMLYMPMYPSIAFGLYAYQANTTRNMDTPLYFSALVVTAIPSLILYGMFQDKILVSMNIGGLKG